MRRPFLTTAFKKDLKRQKKRGKAREKLENAMDAICLDGDAPQELSPHNLIGNYAKYRECHLEPDWLLIYAVEKQVVIFHRTGSHSDLFR